MAFNYSGDPAISDKDAVRYLIGDTQKDGHILEDAEIQYEIDNESSVIDAAINATTSIIAELAQDPSAVEAESVSAEYRDRVNHYIQVRKQLKDRKLDQGNNMGQLNVSDILTAQDTDNIFEVDQFVNNERF